MASIPRLLQVAFFRTDTVYGPPPPLKKVFLIDGVITPDDFAVERRIDRLAQTIAAEKLERLYIRLLNVYAPASERYLVSRIVEQTKKVDGVIEFTIPSRLPRSFPTRTPWVRRAQLNALAQFNSIYALARVQARNAERNPR